MKLEDEEINYPPLANKKIMTRKELPLLSFRPTVQDNFDLSSVCVNAKWVGRWKKEGFDV